MKAIAKSLAVKMRGPLLGLLFSIFLCTLLVVCIGESPVMLWEAFKSTLLTPFGLGYTLYYATPLIFTGLAVAIAGHCGLFNIGAEGQLYAGALAAVAVGAGAIEAPAALLVPLILLAAALAGAATVEAIGKATCAGTNCGSCRPEIARLLESCLTVEREAAE